jgi:hypothetical protein
MPKASTPKLPLLDAIEETILRLNDAGGSSKQRLLNQLRGTPVGASVTTGALGKALDSGVALSRLVLTGLKYHVAGHEPPTPPTVSIVDVLIGSGATAEPGRTCTLTYRGTLAEGGAQFDAAAKFSFELGAGEVIKGMDLGVTGMKVGGERLVTIPSELAYGKRGSPPEIPPNAALIFSIKLRTLQ